MDQLIVDLIRRAIEAVSPQLKSNLIQVLKEWETRAKETKTPWDDLLCTVLLSLLQ